MLSLLGSRVSAVRAGTLFAGKIAGLLGKNATALRAGIYFFAGMNPPVYEEAGSLCETFPTLGAGEWFLPCVDSLVLHQDGLPREAFIALVTRVPFFPYGNFILAEKFRLLRDVFAILLSWDAYLFCYVWNRSLFCIVSIGLRRNRRNRQNRQNGGRGGRFSAAGTEGLYLPSVSVYCQRKKIPTPAAWKFHGASVGLAVNEET